VRIAAEAIHSIALASDGKPVLAACIRDKAGGVTNGCLVRLNADGSLDSSFAEQGMFLLASERITSDLKALAVQGDDKIVAAGFTGENNDDDQRQLVVLRLLADGRLDLDFGEAGRVRAALDGGFLPQSLALQPDGKIVVAGGAHLKNRSSFALARLETNGALDKSFGNGGRVILPLGAGESVIRSIVLQDDGKIVAGGYVLDASNDDESKNFALARFNVDGSLDRTYSSNGAQGVEFSPNSTRLYVYAEQCLEAWDVLSGERIARTFTPKSDIKTLRASSDGKWLAAATDGRGYVWDATDVYAHPRVLSESKGGVHQVDFAAASETAVVVRHGGAGELIAFNSDEKATELGPLLEGGPPRILKMSPDGRLMAVGGGNAINLFRTADWKPAGRIINGHGRIFDAVFIPDGLALVTADVHGDVVAWQISDDGPPLSPIGGREPWLARDDITTLALAPDGLLAACGDSSGNIAVVALASGEAVYVHRPREVPVRGLSFVDGAAKLLTAYADGQIQTVDIRLGQVVGRWSCGRPIQAVAKAPQGDRLAIAYGDLLQIAVIDWPSGKERWRIPALPGSKVLAFSPGGQELVIACGATMSVHNASSGVNLAMAGNLGEEFVDVHVFADGKHMLVAEGTRGLTLRSFPDCRVLARVLDHADGVKAVAVTPDGRNFATADHEDQLRILDARTMQPLLVLKGAEKSGSLSPLQFSVNGDKLVGAWGKRIVVWSAGKP